MLGFGNVMHMHKLCTAEPTPVVPLNILLVLLGIPQNSGYIEMTRNSVLFFFHLVKNDF